ncbi:MAG TPA: hypothetical protein VF614_17885 [Chthoniobacteraceae bacterium]
MSSLRIPQLILLALVSGFAGGCATVADVTVTPDMQRDFKNHADFQIAYISELERRLERAETKDKNIDVLDFAGSSIQSMSARSKLLFARYPELRDRRVAEMPAALRQEIDRSTRYSQEKAYVFASLRAGAAKYSSHPSVMKALQRFVVAVQSADQ